MKRVGVTGAAGFIGSHLCERMLDEGLEVVGIDDLSMGSVENIRPCLERPGFTFNPTNCSKLAFNESLAGMEGVSSVFGTPFQVTNCATLGF